MDTEERQAEIASQARWAVAFLAQVDTLVTDSELRNDAVAELEAAGPKVVRA